MDFFPIFLRLQQQPCLVVGGGEIALRKIRLLARAGAQITVVAPELCAELEQMRAAGALQHLAQNYQPDHLKGSRLVIAATDDDQVNEQVAAEAQALGLWVNVVDNPKHCSFITPAIVDRSPLLIAIASGGGVPVLVRQVRAQLEALIPRAYSQLADLAKRYRVASKNRFADVNARRQFWEQVFTGPMVERVLAGRMQEAEHLLQQALEHADPERLRQGEVYLVGSGPGNPDLLTFRAFRLMQLPDVVLYDQLVSPEILDLVRRDAERIAVGKARKNHTMPQEDINQLMVQLAQAGKKVLRLKGGDPFIFGRGGEEISTLAQHGIAFQVVPGITSAQGAACYAGIPLTHRDYAQGCSFVTGHRQDRGPGMDWSKLARADETVVVYMGLHQAEVIQTELLAHGRAASTPVAVVERATMPEQRVCITQLDQMAQTIAQQQIQSPALIIIGEVVQLHQKLQWFQQEHHDAATMVQQLQRP